MAATVTYKGSTLTTVNNQTRTLNTSGKYMEGDITITDVTGGAAAITVTDTLDANGGIIREITAVDISNDTVDAAHLVQGYTAHDRTGAAITGTYTGGGITPSGTINITTNGTHDVTSYAYASVSVPTGGTVNNQDKTVYPSETVQYVTADSGYTGLGTVTVSAISSTYVGTGVTRKTAQTYTPGTTAQTIASNQYLTGIQTIAAIPSQYIVPAGSITLSQNGTTDVTQYASAIVSIPFVTYFTGTSAPSSSLGSNGDIYLQTSN